LDPGDLAAAHGALVSELREPDSRESIVKAVCSWRFIHVLSCLVCYRNFCATFEQEIAIGSAVPLKQCNPRFYVGPYLALTSCRNETYAFIPGSLMLIDTIKIVLQLFLIVGGGVMVALLAIRFISLVGALGAWLAIQSRP
jgi:hypothetical protein